MFPGREFLLDWHVYAAGSRQLLDGTLYAGSLTSPFEIPVNSFNLPPGAAVLATPFVVLREPFGGIAWIAMGVIAMAACCIGTARILELRQPLLVGGAFFALYAAHPWFSTIRLGNVNPLVLLLVVAFCWEHMHGHQRRSGAILAAAAFVKLWPIALAVVLIRDRRWIAMRWTVALLLVATVGTMAWLGIDRIPGMVESLYVKDTVGPDSVVLGVSAIALSFPWWPAWGGLAVCAALLAIPAKGRMGVGLAVIAATALIPNLWRHYLPTLVFALVLIGADVPSHLDTAAERARMTFSALQQRIQRHSGTGGA